MHTAANRIACGSFIPIRTVIPGRQKVSRMAACDRATCPVDASTVGSLRGVNDWSIVFEVLTETKGENMFDLEQFIDDCKRAVLCADSREEVQAWVQQSVSVPLGVLKALGEPKQAGVQRLYVADDLTILNVLWGPHMMLMPHNHEMWAVIGVYTGREDNIFWRRLPEENRGKLKAAGARSLAATDVEALGRDAIHSVTNPLSRITGGLHVYGGSFFQTPRSEWDPELLLESTFDVEKNLRLFEESNRGLQK